LHQMLSVTVQNIRLFLNTETHLLQNRLFRALVASWLTQFCSTFIGCIFQNNKRVATYLSKNSQMQSLIVLIGHKS
jgi:hypothetical protein